MLRHLSYRGVRSPPDSSSEKPEGGVLEPAANMLLKRVNASDACAPETGIEEAWKGSLKCESDSEGGKRRLVGYMVFGALSSGSWGAGEGGRME